MLCGVRGRPRASLSPAGLSAAQAEGGQRSGLWGKEGGPELGKQASAPPAHCGQAAQLITGEAQNGAWGLGLALAP